MNPFVWMEPEAPYIDGELPTMNNEPIDAEYEAAKADQPGPTTALAVRPAAPVGEALPPDQIKPPITAAQAKVEAVANLTFKAYEKAGTLVMTPDEVAKLQAPFPDDAFKPGAAGKENLIYIEHAYLRERFSEVFGPGQWAIIPRNRWAEDFTFVNKYKETVEASRVYVEAMLLVRGAFVAEAIGDMVYYKKNDTQNYGDAVEGAKTAAFRRCAKELGVGLQAWKKDFCEGWWQRRKAPRSSPATPPPTKPHWSEPKAPAPTQTPKQATPVAPEKKPKTYVEKLEACKAKLVAELMADGGKMAVAYAREQNWLMSDDEGLDAIPPYTFFASANPALPWEENVKLIKQDRRNLYVAIFGVDPDEAPEAPVEPPAESEPEPPPEGDRMQGKIEYVSVKTGTGKKGNWTLYGVKVNGEWLNTFDTKLGKEAEAMKGMEVTAHYEQTEKGKNLVALEAI